MKLVAQPSLQTHIEAYARSHRTLVNKALHYIGIPLAAIALLGLTSKIRFTRLEFSGATPDACWIVGLFIAAWYLYEDWKVAGLPIAALMTCYFVGRNLDAWLLGSLIVIAAVLHLIGHYGFEGKPPELLSRPIALLEAPAWLIAALAGVLPNTKTD